MKKSILLQIFIRNEKKKKSFKNDEICFEIMRYDVQINLGQFICH